jgi:hypothetical protein
MKKVWILGLTLICLMIGSGIAGAATGDFVSRAAGNWNAVATWCKFLTGTASFTNGSAAVTGTSTLFTTELVAGDVLMLQATTGTIRGTVLSIGDDTHLTLTSNALATASGAYGKQASPTSADGVITITHAVTVTADVTVDQVANSADFAVSSGATLTIANGTGTDFATSGATTTITINGTLNIDGQMSGSNTFTISSTGIVNVSTGSTLTVNQGAGPSLTINSGGNLNITGSGSVAVGSIATLNVSGTITMSGSSTLSVDRGNGGSVGSILSGGLISMSGTTTFTNGSVLTGFYTIASGGTLIMGPTALLNGGGTFTIASGANIEIGSAAGITSAGATGNIQSNGRNYNVGANYTYNGTAAQVTGNGLPATVNTLTIDNSTSVTLSQDVTVTGALTVSKGIFNQGTGSEIVTNGTFDTNLTGWAGSGWAWESGGRARHSSGTTALTQSAATVVIGKTYEVKYDVYGVTAGSVTMSIGGQSGTAKSAAGSYTDRITATATTALKFTPTTDFNGAIDNVSVSESGNVTAGSVSVSAGATYRNRGTGSLTLGGNVTNSGTIDFNGSDASCGDANKITISGGGTQRTWSGGTIYMTDINVSDAGGTVTCYGCTNTSNNAWTFADCTGWSSPTAVKLASFTATDYNGNILLQWQTGYEVDNLGFHIYSEEKGQRVRLTPELVAGSALLVRGAALTAGLPYQWWDTSFSIDPRAGVKYWLEDLDLKGKRTMHGPITPIVSNEPLPQTIKPEFLSELGKRLDEKFEEFWRIQDLKERLRLASEGKGALRSRSTALEAASVLKAQGSTPQGNFVPDPQAQTSAAPASQPTSMASASLKAVQVVPVVLGQPSQQDITKQWSLASGPAVKLSVKEEGWYRVGQPELVAAGLSSKINPRYLQLFVDGKEQAIRVVGESDKRFDPQDGIEFYGVGLDTASTDRRVYWLVVGSGLGKRISTYTGKGSSGAPLSFSYTVERQERTTYFPALINGEDDNFFGPMIIGAAPSQQLSEVDQLLSVFHLDPAAHGSASLEVALQGVTTVPHQVQILFNEVQMGEMAFNGQSKGVIKFTISQSGIPEGDNIVTLIAQGGEEDMSLVDYIRLTYWHTYTADNDALKFSTQGGKKLSVSGFSSQNIRVVDITDPSAVVEVAGTVNSQGTGYAITFGAPGSGPRSLLAFTDEQVEHPVAITANQPTTWHETNNAADLVIIAHGNFIGSLGPLETLREGQGLSTALIDVGDLYDEFSFGNKNPQALRDFLSRAKSSWQKPPRFVLLVGDASYDPRDYLGWAKLGKLDFVPTKLVGTAYQETASDDWFVDFNGDRLPEMAIGRLPVRTSNEAATVVTKIVGYEQSPADAWARQVLFVADVDPKHEFDFEAATIPLEALIPSGFGVDEIFRSRFNKDSEVKAELLNSINSIDQGALIVNFIGHGTLLGWGGAGGLLSSGDASSLVNGLRLPFFISMTCLNGFFQAPYADTLAEALLKVGSGGGIAVWASSGMTEPDGQVVMNKELVQQLFNKEGLTGLTIGEAVMKAKAAVSDQDVRRTWILFGDPTTRLK